MRQRLVKLADERAVKHVHQRQPHGQLGLPARVDTALPGERDSPRTSLERPPPQQLSRQGQQELGCVREQLRPDLVEVERADDGRVGQHVAYDPLAEQADGRGLFTGGQQMPRCRAGLAGLDQVVRGGLMQPLLPGRVPGMQLGLENFFDQVVIAVGAGLVIHDRHEHVRAVEELEHLR